MNYIVLDLEWNQPIHTDSKSNEITKSKYMLFEIIEVGAVKLDENLNEIDRFNKLIKPVLHKKINPIISNITGIKERDLSKEKKFPAVFEEFINWCGEDYIMCTFGNQDIYELEINMQYHNINIPWKYPLKYIDVQRIFSIENDEINEQRSLEMVCMFMGVSGKNAYHRALSDAIYTAEIMKKMNRNNFEKYMSLDYTNLPLDRSEEKEINLGTHLEFLSRSFKDKEEMLANKDIYITRCPVCLKKCRKKIKWFSDGTKYICMARCENHGLMEGILYIKKNYNGYYIVRKTTGVDEERFMDVVKKRNILKEKRKIRRIKEREKKKKFND